MSSFSIAEITGADRGAKSRDSKTILQKFGVVSQLSKVFAMQSYHSTTLLEKAILVQNSNYGIVNTPNTSAVNVSIEDSPQVRGKGVGLHPDCQCPVAIRFASKDSRDSKAIILAPGQVVFPFGGEYAFDGFSWGLPFGWLGGGLATLLVVPDVNYLLWGAAASTEIVFHRVTIPINTAAAGGDARVNWPTRFPWPGATSGSVPTPQPGRPSLQVTATRVQMILNGATLPLAAQVSMRALMQGMDQWTDANDLPVVTKVAAEGYVWPQFAKPGGAGNLTNAMPSITAIAPDNLLAGVGANGTTQTGTAQGGVAFLDDSGAAVLANAFVDCVRYGRL